MKNWMSALALLSILVWLPSCVRTETIVETRTEYAAIPAGLLILPGMPEIATNPLTLEEALEIGKALRTHSCILHSRYKEVIRYATGGNTIIEDLKESDCANLNH